MDFEVTSNAEQIMAEFTGLEGKIPGVLGQVKQAAANAILRRIPSNMHWKQDDGILSTSFSFNGNEVGSDLPYARRRDMGFFGTDSLGRKYNDVGAFYMRDSIQGAGSDIDTAFMSLMGDLFG